MRAAAGPSGQVDAQPSVLREDRGALDHVLQFADIAGPVVARQPPRIAFRQAQIRISARLLRQKMLRQQRNVLAALAQRHRLHREAR